MSVKLCGTKERDQGLGSNFVTDILNELGVSHLSSWAPGFLFCKITCPFCLMDIS